MSRFLRDQFRRGGHLPPGVPQQHAAQQFSAPLAGEAAIRRIFAMTAQQVKQYPRMMVSFIAYIVTNEISPDAEVLDAPDRFLRYPQMPELHEASIPSGNEMLLYHLNEIAPGQDHTETLLHLASSFYGDVLVAHTSGVDIGMLYTKSLDLILGRVSEGAASRPGLEAAC